MSDLFWNLLKLLKVNSEICVFENMATIYPPVMGSECDASLSFRRYPHWANWKSTYSYFSALCNCIWWPEPSHVFDPRPILVLAPASQRRCVTLDKFCECFSVCFLWDRRGGDNGRKKTTIISRLVDPGHKIHQVQNCSTISQGRRLLPLKPARSAPR